MINKTIILDLDDTLYCEHDYVRSGFEAVAHYIAGHSEFTPNHIYNQLIAYWQERGRGQVFDLTCAFFHIDDIDIAELVQVYRFHTPSIQLYDDAVQFLDDANMRKLPLGLITDGTSITQWNKIKALQLVDRIEAIVVSDDLGGSACWKPNKAPYQLALKQLDKLPEQCIYVGDNPHKDFITARKLGMETVRIVRSIGDHMNTRLDKAYEADWEIHALTELIDRQGT
ncbi:HAD family hydrolase [Gracilibacillus alcaliphilus]|uniref:HAD family hydrolase n=1 Tax=Gracilibacillus alcaliphilus TaxID=1401441 RepID=UPI0019586B34|nr:HAD family hydrolase [Gracilibacillus alcaliphilus]MBM7676015.1 putative hydrolase of the HAD superfamily [Gracilibacillus alcaliphilus]